MRVLQVHNHYRQLGGEDVAVAAEAQLLEDAGHEVVRFRTSNPTGVRAAAELAVAPHNALSARDLVHAARRAAPDVVHVHNTWFHLTPAVVAALARRGYPVVMTLHNYRLFCANAVTFRDGEPCEDCVSSHPFHSVVHGCYRGSRMQSVPAALTIASSRNTWRRGVRLFLCLTEFGQRLFVRSGIPASRLRVKPHFVRQLAHRPAPPSTSDEVICIGRLDPGKGIDVLIAAFDRLDDPRLRLTIVGDGPELARLQALAGSRVTLTGRLSHDAVLAKMLRARVLAFPTLMYETFGMTMIEAMAAGLPVLASDRGGTAQILGPDAGAVVTAGDVDAWVRGLSLAGDDHWIDTAGARGHARWASHFSPDRNLLLLERAYDEALGSVGEP